MQIHLLRSTIIGTEDQLSNASILASASNQVILTVNLGMGKRCFVTHVGASVNTAGGLGQITFQLLKNGSTLYPYGPNQNQWADPSLGTEIPRFEVEQGSKLEVVASNADASNAYDCSARIKVEYEDF